MNASEGKLVLLGSHGVGKTSLVTRFVGQTPATRTSPTIGASFFVCFVKVKDARIKLQIWDTAGQEKFRSLAPIYYRNADAALLVFDISDYQSFLVVKIWVKELLSNVRNTPVMTLVGNKADLEAERKVPFEEAHHYALSINAHYYESSACNDQGIERPFSDTAYEIVKRQREKSNDPRICYDFDSLNYDGSFVPSVECTSQRATALGKTESLPRSIDSVAHASVDKAYLCC